MKPDRSLLGLVCWRRAKKTPVAGNARVPDCRVDSLYADPDSFSPTPFPRHQGFCTRVLLFKGGRFACRCVARTSRTRVA